jgi:hypothetical protein
LQLRWRMRRCRSSPIFPISASSRSRHLLARHSPDHPTDIPSAPPELLAEDGP